MTNGSLRVAVVGAGPAGLTAAYWLQRAGLSVVVLEAEEWIGGRTRTDRLDGFGIDAGAQLFGSMYARFFTLVEALGIGDRVVRTPGRDALWLHGQANEVVYGSITSMLSAGGLSFRTKMRLGTHYLPFLHRHAADLEMHAPERAAAAGLDGESIGEWGMRELGPEFVEYLVYPQLAAFYGGVPEETSAGLYHILARHGTDVSVYALKRGAATFCEAIAEWVRSHGGQVRVASPVERLRLSGDRVQLSGSAPEEEFDAAVVAVPAPVARRLISEFLPDAADWLEGVRYRPALTLGLLLDRPVGARYFGLSFPRAAARAASAVCVEENKQSGLVPEGRGLLVAFAQPGVASRLVRAEARDVFDALLPDLLQPFPGLQSRVTRARVYRWPVGNPVFYPGYLGRLAAFRRLAAGQDAPVVLAGDYLYSCSVEGAVTSGIEAARSLLARLGSPRAQGGAS